MSDTNNTISAIVFIATIENYFTTIFFGQFNNFFSSKNILGIETSEYDIHINFPGGMPVDGPSAGVAIFCAVYSAITNKKISNTVAATGEISIFGDILPVGGVNEKVLAASEAGAKCVIVPEENFTKSLLDYGIDVIPAGNIKEVVDRLFGGSNNISENSKEVLTAKGAV